MAEQKYQKDGLSPHHCMILNMRLMVMCPTTKYKTTRATPIIIPITELTKATNLL